MSPTVADLGKKAKAKYPGSYEDLSDDDLGKKIKAKYPGSYDDFQDAAPITQAAPSKPRSLWDKAMDFSEGASDAAAHTTLGAYEMARKGLGHIGVNLPEPSSSIRAATETPPDASDARKLGRTVETVAPYFSPMGANPLGAAAIAGAQSEGNPAAMVGAAAVPALIRGGGALMSAAKRVNPDVVGLISPRAAHGVRIAQKLGKAFGNDMGAAAEEVPDYIARQPQLASKAALQSSGGVRGGGAGGTQSTPLSGMSGPQLPEAEPTYLPKPMLMRSQGVGGGGAGGTRGSKLMGTDIQPAPVDVPEPVPDYLTKMPGMSAKALLRRPPSGGQGYSRGSRNSPIMGMGLRQASSGAAATGAESAAPAVDPLWDDIARSQARGKPYSSLTPDEQLRVQRMAGAGGPKLMPSQPKPIPAEHAANRAALARDAAQALHNEGNGISSADAAGLDDNSWKHVEALTDVKRGVPKGENRTNLSDPDTRRMVLDELSKLENQ